MDEDLDNNPAVRLANSLSRFMSVAIALASAAPHPVRVEPATPAEPDPDDASALSEPHWARYCDSVPLGERKNDMLGALAEFMSLAPLVELPHVHGPKQMLRDTMAKATELEPLIASWDEATDPTAEMTATASAILDIIQAAPPGETP